MDSSSDNKVITEQVAERLAVAAITKALGGSWPEAAALLKMPRVGPLRVNADRHARLFGRLWKAAEKAVKRRLSSSTPRYIKIGKAGLGYSEGQILDWMDQVAFTIASQYMTIEKATEHVGVNCATFASQRRRMPEAWQEALKRHGLGWEQGADWSRIEREPDIHVRARLRKAAAWAVLGLSYQFISRNFGLSDAWLTAVLGPYLNYWGDLCGEAAKAWGIPEGYTARTVILDNEGKVAIHGRKRIGCTKTSSRAEKEEVPRVFQGLTPTWDKGSGELRMGRKVIRKVDLLRAENLVLILDAFQLAKWSGPIPDPLRGPSGHATANRLKQAVKILNRGLKMIRFGTQNGKTVTWCKQ